MNILNWITNLDLAINHWIQENLRNDFLTRFFYIYYFFIKLWMVLDIAYHRFIDQ